MVKKTEYEPNLIATISCANGVNLRIVQITKGGGCAVEDVDSRAIHNRTGSIESAWASVRYQAGITVSTQRSKGAEEMLTPMSPAQRIASKKAMGWK